MHEHAAQLPLLPWQALLKALGLGYLLGLLGMALATTLWRCLRPRLAPAARAAAGSALLLGAALLQTLLAALIWYGVVNLHIRMTTMHFHKLMHGEWSALISIGGLSVLAASLLIATWSYRRTRLDCHGTQPLGWAGPLPLRAAQQVATAALVGVFRPQVWANPQWWEQLAPDAREMALAHELEHWRSGDNWRKLLLEWLAVFYAVLPAARRWPRDYELDCELAVDTRCRQRFGDSAYRELLATTAGFVLARRTASHESLLAPASSGSASALGSSGLQQRLQALDTVQHATGLPLLAATVGGGWLLSLLPGLLLLSHPVPRCLLACYLGY